MTRLEALTVPELVEGPLRPAQGPTFRHATPLDPQARIVLADLEREYDARYGNLFGEPASTEINRYPAEVFSAPAGTFLLVETDGRVVSAGAFMTIDAATVEVKRMWTHSDHRGRGLAKLVLAELEAEARRRGFSRVVLSTGPRQPEAVRLYLATGYTPLFDRSLPPEEIVIHHFEKELS
ncbi:GNAT family N-acetyltransferase [Conyzicola nivalis]|uniref:N-acetyltransferase n=1 Tax=Conyzicola nivalis TaxID=1477021 RepID=A0A916SUP3_9MICO|nr:GNAT family N-acetyltransferase [Conyzicola nivalis]GGB14335.1 N-acetyltransferase [Conyzicola nivalis]